MYIYNKHRPIKLGNIPWSKFNNHKLDFNTT